jgi:hypothetical protein
VGGWSFDYRTHHCWRCLEQQRRRLDLQLKTHEKDFADGPSGVGDGARPDFSFTDV